MFDFRILTVRQPWASAMFFGLSPKDVENRTMPPPPSLIGKRLYIHAGEGMDRDDLAFVRAMGFDPFGLGAVFDGPVTALSIAVRRKVLAARRGEIENPLPSGVILGSVLLDGYSRESDSPWRDHNVEYGWILRDPQPLARPVPVPGGGQLTHGWRPSDDVAAALLEQEFGAAA